MLYDHRGNRKYLTSTERRAFMDAAKRARPEVETFCLTLAYTGARISEVLALTPQRVDHAAQAIVFESLKKRTRGIYRAVPVPKELLARVEQVHASTPSTNRVWAWSRTTAWQRVKEVMREAKVSPSSAKPKALRHAFGVMGVVEANAPLNMVQKWMGHARIETTAIYANAIGVEERRIAARLWGSIL